MKLLILGGTGVISREIVNEALIEGHEVTIVNRGSTKTQVPPEVELLKQDRRERDVFSALFSARTFDVVIDMICFDISDAQHTIDLFRDKTSQIVIISSVAAYKRPYLSIPVKEDKEEYWDDPEYSYGYEKALMEKFLLKEIQAGTPITIVRPSLTFGSGSRNVGVLRQNAGILSRISQGKPLIMFGDGKNPWSFSFSGDMARGILGVTGNNKAIGQAFHIASQERTDWNDLYREFGKLVGKKPIIEYIPSNSLYRINKELFGHIHFEKSYPGLFDEAKIQAAVPEFKHRISLAQGLTELVESWNQEGLKPDEECDKYEDNIVNLIKSMYFKSN